MAFVRPRFPFKPYFSSGSPPSNTLTLYLYNGSAWVAYSIYRYNGTAWVATTLYRYNGTNWVF